MRRERSPGEEKRDLKGMYCGLHHIGVSVSKDAHNALPGSADFLATDPYSSQFVRAPPGGFDACIANQNDPLWPSCEESVGFDVNGWSIGVPGDGDSLATPRRLRGELREIQKRWPTKKIVSSCK